MRRFEILLTSFWVAAFATLAIIGLSMLVSCVAHAAPCNAYDGSMWSHRCNATAHNRYVSVASGVGIGPKPRRWCGWYMRTQKGGGPEYNLAWNWRRRGVAGSPQVGAVVVWRHHVGMIVGRTNKGWLVKSGNDGGAVRTRVRSIRGAAIRIGV